MRWLFWVVALAALTRVAHMWFCRPDTAYPLYGQYAVDFSDDAFGDDAFGDDAPSDASWSSVDNSNAAKLIMQRFKYMRSLNRQASVGHIPATPN